MEFDNSWRAVLRPGKANVYFDRRGDFKFDAGASSYSPINAWWLAEISRLIYREDRGGIRSGARGETRDQILRRAGLREVEFFDRAGTQAALVRSEDPAQPPFTVLVFRGTDGPRDWITDMNLFPLRWRPGGSVHRGFGKALLSVWGKIEVHLDALDSPLFMTGHSLGASLATLAASLRPPRALYTFGSPLPGYGAFAATMRDQRAYRVVNNLDLIATLPPSRLGFRHCGELRYIGRGGRIHVNPSADAVASDRSKRSQQTPPSADRRRGIASPPQRMADHAPVNYVAHLERAAEVGVTRP